MSPRLLSWVGRDPDSAFRERFRLVSALRLPISSGIGPDSALKYKVRLVSLVRLPISSGIGPDSAFRSMPR